MDIRPVRHTAAAEEPPHAKPKPAASLHTRGAHTGGKVLDLRAAKPLKAAQTRPKTTPGHWTGTQSPAEKLEAGHAHAAPAAAPKTTAHERHLAHFEDRFKRAKDVQRSEHISRFGSGQHLGNEARPANAEAKTDPAHHAVLAPETPAPELPSTVATQHQAMAQLANIQQAGHQHDTSWRPHLGLAPRAGQYAAATVAVIIMGGYIWLQNYPKMAIQSAAAKAGLAASMPGYVPSSYNLTDTKTAPGLVTLDFTSPSQAGTLTITQHRTTWDSSSLLDRFIATKSTEYTAVQGQGLTIYLYGQNQAAWVNHGVWYNIEGASRLSREQILKIAYSL